MTMRWIFALFLILTGFYLTRGNSTTHLAIRRLSYSFFIFAGLASIIFADSWTKISVALGVENGTALLTYLVTFTFIASIISNSRWRKFQEQRIVDLARKIAIDEANKKSK